jgi:hypothetical protein
MNQPPTEEEHRDIEHKHWAKLEKRSWWLNIFTCIAAVVGLLGLGGLILTLQQARTSTVAANRAWLSPITGVFYPVPAVGQPAQVAIQFVNSGHEPAVDVTFSVRFDTAPMPQNKNLMDTEKVTDNVCDPIPNFLKTGVVSPGGPWEAVVSTNGNGNNILWDLSLDAEHTLLRVKTCAKYISFNETHYTASCRLFDIQTYIQTRTPSPNPAGQGTMPRTAQGATEPQEALPGPTTGQGAIPNEYHREPIRRGIGKNCNGGDSAN